MSFLLGILVGIGVGYILHKGDYYDVIAGWFKR